TWACSPFSASCPPALTGVPSPRRSGRPFGHQRRLPWARRRPRGGPGVGRSRRDDLLNGLELLVVLVDNRPRSEGDAVTTTPDIQPRHSEHALPATGRWQVGSPD